MNAVLDTSVQIDRIFGSKKRKASIKETTDGCGLYSTAYVLGEYYSNIVNDFVTMYAVINQSNDIFEAEKRINEKAFGRSQNRMHKIFINLRERFSNDLDFIKIFLKSYFDILVHEFYKGIDKNLLNGSKCRRAEAYIEYIEGCPVIKNISCRQTDGHCETGALWKKYFTYVEKLTENENVNGRLREILKKASALNPPKGNSCRSAGDLIICLESVNGGINAICTSNAKDFKPIAERLGITLLIPEYK